MSNMKNQKPDSKNQILDTRPRRLVRQIIAGVLFLSVYLPTLIWMWDRWFARDSYYSHGILIPFVAGYLIWQKKDELQKIVCVRSRLGMVLIVVGIIVHLISSILRIYFSSGFSMLLVLVGLILHFYGKKVMRVVLFPVGFLFFMIPIPLVVIVNISFQMKLFAAEIAEQVLNGMGLTAEREGSVIIMENTKVVVDDVCSGLRSLISLTALGSIFAYWLDAPVYKRIGLFLTTIPIAVITNVFRVVVLSFVSEVWGPKYATGFMHDATGFLVFGLAFVLLYAAARIIE
ncbi:MAG: exosortase/archaeosortase family protein [Candidatus Omnitrophica bacterium]|nr:exosortase/archaeosortase family protein [Candidatus Omnitrophota bacterium]